MGLCQAVRPPFLGGEQARHRDGGSLTVSEGHPSQGHGQGGPGKTGNTCSELGFWKGTHQNVYVCVYIYILYIYIYIYIYKMGRAAEQGQEG